MTLLKTAPAIPRRRRWLTVAGVITIVVLLYPSYRACDYALRTGRGQALMSEGEHADAARHLEGLSESYPRDAEAAFLAAVAHRRSGNSERFEKLIARAEQLGWPVDQVRLQQILARTQHGLGDEDTQKQLIAICQAGADDFTAEQIYEAQAKGFMSIYQVNDALLALNFWIDWKPRAVAPRLLRAQLYLQAEDMMRAEPEFRTILEAQPDHLESRIHLAQLLLITRRNEEARAQFETAARLAPNDPRIIVGMAELEARTGADLSEFEPRLKELLDSKLENGDVRQQALLLLSNCYLNRGEYQEVVALLEDAESKGQLDIPSYKSLARAYMALKRRDKAQHYTTLQEQYLKRRDEVLQINELIRSNPRDPGLRFRLGEIHYEGGDKKGALTWWYTALLLEPRHQSSHEALADHFAREGNLAKAELHRKAAESSAERTFALAWKYYERDDLPAVQLAISKIARYAAFKPHAQLLEIAIQIKTQKNQLNPSALQPLYKIADYPTLRPYAVTLLGAGMYQVGQFGESEMALLEVIHNDPNSLEAHRWLLALNFDIRAFTRARFHADTIARLDGSDYRPHRLLGLMAKVMQNWDMAIDAYHESLKRDPNQPTKQQVLTELADCQIRARKHADAIATLDQATESIERNILLAECLFHTGETDEADKILAGVMAQDPQNPAANLLRSDLIIERKGKLEDALKHVQTILDNYPFSDAAWLKLAQIYSRQGKSEEAKQASDKSTELRNHQIRYSRLIDTAVLEPENIDVRRELAAIARQFGRDDLAKEWDRAAEIIQAKGRPQSAAATTGPGGDRSNQTTPVPPLVVPDAGK